MSFKDTQCPECGANFVAARIATRDAAERAKRGNRGAFEFERKMVRSGTTGGVILVVLAVVWFVAGYAAGYIFYYPPILAVIGLYGIVKGVSGPPPSRGRARRRR